ncbi:MAG: insulinase family protein [Alphaproteobacteria bacterium]|nr:insulinase family protein [Alphaproteobacteria bacterium]
MRAPILLCLALLGCPKTPAPEAAAEGVRPFPEALPERPFVMPEVERATLSNGLQLAVVRNDEVGLFNVRLFLRGGSSLDPAGKEGLAELTFDMLDRGAAGRSAAELAKALKPLGGTVGAGAGRDSAAVSVSGPSKNLEPLLDLWADVLLRPDFPADEWSLLQSKAVADHEASLEQPTEVGRRVYRHVAYGDAYTGRLTTSASLGGLTRGDLVAHHAAVLDPSRAVLMAGGDVDLATLVPLLEARLGSLGAASPLPLPAPAIPAEGEGEVIYVVDKPGAPQSVLRALLPVMDRTDPAWWPFMVGNTAFGGAFTARVNMNLREDKGWTYGARCGLDDNTGPSLWLCSTSVQSDATVVGLAELRKETRDVLGDRPITADELAYFQGYLVNGFYGSYETPGELLGELWDIWTYGLPADWLERYVPSVQAVDVAGANAALRSAIDPDRIAWIVVGDLATHREGLEALGLPVVELDRDGRPVAEAP